MSCSSSFCSSRSNKVGNKDRDVSFHLFPKCPEIRSKWIEALRRENWTPNKYSRICSKHFENSWFINGLSIKKLKSDAVPTIFDESQKNYPAYSPFHAAKSAHTWQLNGPESTNCEIDAQAANICADYNQDDEYIKTHNISHDDTHIAKEDSLRNGFTCNVCHQNITGFRYTCLQCVDWDMCTSCEARGEHALHYVLRLPAPTTQVESVAVIASIRRHIADMLKLRDEMQGIAVKEEILEPSPAAGLSSPTHWDHTYSIKKHQQDASTANKQMHLEATPITKDITEQPELRTETCPKNITGMEECEVKEEMIEVKDEFDVEVTEHSMTPEFHHSRVPEVYVPQNSSYVIKRDPLAIDEAT